MSGHMSPYRHNWDRNGKFTWCKKQKHSSSPTPSGSRASNQYSTTGSPRDSRTEAQPSSGHNTNASGPEQPVAETYGGDYNYKGEVMFDGIDEDPNSIYNPYWLVLASKDNSHSSKSGTSSKGPAVSQNINKDGSLTHGKVEAPSDSTHNTSMPTAQASGSFTNSYASTIQARYHSSQPTSGSASSYLYQSASQNTIGPSSANYIAPAQQQQQAPVNTRVHLQNQPDVGNAIAPGNHEEDFRTFYDSWEALPSPPIVDISGLTGPPKLQPWETMFETSCIRCRGIEAEEGLTYRLCKRDTRFADRRCMICKELPGACQNYDGTFRWP